jgi:diguanylate cyclase (GGDEF)-like protein
MRVHTIRRLHELLSCEVERARRSGRDLSVVLIDVDGLRAINDALGRDAGDALLGRLSDALAAALRGEDTAVRYAGDEWLVVLPETTAAAAAAIADRAQEAFGAACAGLGAELRAPVRFSAGVAEYRPGRAWSDLIDAAHEALARAKGSRRVAAVAGAEGAAAGAP